MRIHFAALALIALAAPALPQDAPEPATPNSVVAAAPASDWKPIDPADLLVMDLAPDSAGKPRRVVIQLISPPFSQGWVENIRKLAKAHWWDGTQVYRVQDNYVVQWGDVLDEKALPEGLKVVPEREYVVPQSEYFTEEYDLVEASFEPGNEADAGTTSVVTRAMSLLESIEPDGQAKSQQFLPGLTDSYAPFVGHWQGWNLAGDSFNAWPTHCYGSVGVARGIDNTGMGSELYTVIGHAPRQLDRNIAVVGRVIEGMEFLSSLPRGDPADLGFYQVKEQWVPIETVRLGNELLEIPQPRFEYLDTESESFARYVELRANRQDAFYKVPAGGVDVCNVQVPIRRMPSE